MSAPHIHQWHDLVDIEADQDEIHSWGAKDPIDTCHTISEVRACPCGETASVVVAGVRESEVRQP